MLEGARLITRGREGRFLVITLLREDGSGEPYTHPADDSPPAYLQLPHQYFLEGRYASLSLPAKAMLLIALTQRDGFTLAAQRVKAWYGLSPDTAERGFLDLINFRLLVRRPVQKSAPLAPKGYTIEYQYTLQPPFGPRGSAAAL